MDRPCIVPTTHAARDKDGYVLMRSRKGPRISTGLHRLAYLSKYGPDSIPPGGQVHHRCGNRECCHRDHLEVLSAADHSKLTNSERGRSLREAARSHWRATGCKAAELSRKFGVHSETGRRWIHRWKADPDAA
ncbi:HNH endonuclease signature motif containing protein [Novosphingobium marinum]|uniref:HNH endonuclease signature motif containing protein n=2 Tax=Novosphingobium marinum TaxID=1514948 RepID=UPI003CC8360A